VGDFKVGDKVTYVPHDPYFSFAVGRVGKIRAIRRLHFPYDVEWPNGTIISMLESELKLAEPGLLVESPTLF
jgi:hypothetical protein